MVEDLVLDRTYAALADPTRRALLVALRDGEARITDLAAPLPMTAISTQLESRLRSTESRSPDPGSRTRTPTAPH